MNIRAEVIPNDQHRKPFTGADWYWDENGDLVVKVSKMSDWRREACLMVHEIVEAILCKGNGVTQDAVDVFDAYYQRNHASDLNAGDDPGAPYEKEHSLATAAERIVSAELGVNWEDYDKELSKL